MAIVDRLTGLARTAVLPKARTGREVKYDLYELDVKRLRLTDRIFLAHLPEGQYPALRDKLREGHEVLSFRDLRIDPPHRLRGFPFGMLSVEFLRENISGMTLDLTELWDKYLVFSRRAKKSTLPSQIPLFDRPAIREVPVESGQREEEKAVALSAERLLAPGNSRLIQYAHLGRQIAGEIIDQPLLKTGHQSGALFKLINEIGEDAWGYFPPEFARERLMDVDKAVILRVGKENAAYTAAKVIPVDRQKVLWVEIALTKKKFQKMHLQTRAFYWLYKEAFLEQVARYIAGRGRFLLLNFVLALPALCRAALYALGWVKKPPAAIARLKAPVAFLAVQPTSLGPFPEYIADIFPNPYRPEIKPDREKIEIARAVLPAGASLDESNLVVMGDYRGIEHLIPDPAKGAGEGGVAEYKDQRINDWMWQNLKYEDKAGRDQLVVMNVTLEDFRTYYARQRRSKLESKAVDRVLTATKDL